MRASIIAVVRRSWYFAQDVRVFFGRWENLRFSLTSAAGVLLLVMLLELFMLLIRWLGKDATVPWHILTT